MFGLFINNASKHVWLEYRRLMAGETHDLCCEDCNNNEHETTILLHTRFEACIMTVLTFLGTDEDRGRMRQKHIVEKFQHFFQ